MKQRSNKNRSDAVVLWVVILVTLFGFVVIGSSPTGHVARETQANNYFATNIIVLVVVGMLTIFLMWKFRQFRDVWNVKPPIANYIERERKKGLSDQQIQEKLTKAGWEQKEFRKYF